MIFLCFIPSIARLEPELEQFELRSIFVGISAIHCWLVWGSRQQANGDGDSDCDGDGDGDDNGDDDGDDDDDDDGDGDDDGKDDGDDDDLVEAKVLLE